MARKFLVTGAAAMALIAAPLTAGTAVAAPAAVTTVYYDTSGAPTFRDVINAGAANWSRAVSNVQLRESSSGASLRYEEGNDP